VFEGVAAYVFRGDALGTIIFEIDAAGALDLYRERAAEMQHVHSENGGHAPWVCDEPSAATFISKNNIVGYRIRSSIGLEGEIWAQRMFIREHA
jgi:hypothetical protein